MWRSRWDSLRLFTAAEHDGLPDLPFPASAGTYPGKDAVADYLETYARTFDLPVRLGTRVTRLRRVDGLFAVETTSGPLTARQVVVATGPFSAPRVPELATGLAPDVVQLHSSAYRRPDDLPQGRVLVVGAGNSGVQIAEELAASGRTVSLAIGSRPRTVPQRPLGRDLFWWLTRTGLIRATVDSRLGRRFRDRELVIGTTWRGLSEQGVTLLPRAVSAIGRTVALADGTTTVVDAVVWATGFRADSSWIDVPGRSSTALPRTCAGSARCRVCSSWACPGSTPAAPRCSGFVREDAAWLATGWRPAASGPARLRRNTLQGSPVPVASGSRLPGCCRAGTSSRRGSPPCSTPHASGSGGALVVRGQPGVGKSTLLADAVARAEGVTVLRTQGIESESPLAFAALQRLLRPVMGCADRVPGPQAQALRAAFGEAAGGDADRFLVFLAALSVLAEAAEQQPVLAVVDDAHWLDDASTAALLFVARRVENERIALLFGARDGDVRRFDSGDLPDLVVGGVDAEAAGAAPRRAGRRRRPPERQRRARRRYRRQSPGPGRAGRRARGPTSSPARRRCPAGCR